MAAAAVVWAGMAIPHTILPIAETSANPTSHNLWPFEYFFLCIFAVPALFGAAAGTRGKGLIHCL